MLKQTFSWGSIVIAGPTSIGALHTRTHISANVFVYNPVTLKCKIRKQNTEMHNKRAKTLRINKRDGDGGSSISLPQVKDNNNKKPLKDAADSKGKKIKRKEKQKKLQNKI